MRKFLNIVVIFILCAALIETVTRGFFAWRVGPNVFAYGTPFYVDPYRAADEIRTVQMHDNELSGYSKYLAGQVRYDVDPVTKERFQVIINNFGFRGRNFEIAKKPNVIRIVTLGASSTFGYYSREDFTYPMQLEGILNNSAAQEFEVINLGIPHLTAEQIAALFEAEAIPLNPDVVTFYEGNNDSARLWEFINDDLQPSLLDSTREFFGGYSVFVAMLNSIILEKEMSPQNLDLELGPAALEVSERFLQALEVIAAECEQRGILFVVSNQQKRSDMFDREKFAGITMQDELKLIQSRASEGLPLTRKERHFYVQMILMQELKNWADDADLPFVDVIKAMDQERDNLLTHVHLSQRGNKIVAQKLSEAILANLNVSQDDKN
ncbi:MAG: SGNH/GDSL hydrolase family protein [Pseudomonadota bacterium]|nr:SGNH/GDSL hydrolase family protein [Pseudomonadota bacterium]